MSTDATQCDWRPWSDRDGRFLYAASSCSRCGRTWTTALRHQAHPVECPSVTRERAARGTTDDAGREET